MPSTERVNGFKIIRRNGYRGFRPKRVACLDKGFSHIPLCLGSFFCQVLLRDLQWSLQWHIVSSCIPVFTLASFFIIVSLHGFWKQFDPFQRLHQSFRRLRFDNLIQTWIWIVSRIASSELPAWFDFNTCHVTPIHDVYPCVIAFFGLVSYVYGVQ